MLNQTTTEQRAELLALAEKATPRPWAYEAHGDTGEYGVGVIHDRYDEPITGLNENTDLDVFDPVAIEVQGCANAAYIAVACNLAPILLRELEFAESQCDASIKEMNANTHSINDVERLTKALALCGISSERYVHNGQHWPHCEYLHAVRNILDQIPDLIAKLTEMSAS